MKKLTIVAAALALAGTVISEPNKALSQDSIDLYNAAGMVTSDQLCGTAWQADGHLDKAVTEIALKMKLSKDSVRQRTSEMSAKQIKDIHAKGKPIEKLCGQLWALYAPQYSPPQ
ncbi:hypothetical protein [Mesorhizobium sp. A556]